MNRPSPQVMKRAAKMTVVPCDVPDKFHVVGGSRPHLVTISRIGGFVCDCESGGGTWCSHRLGTKWFLDAAASTARKN